MKLIYAVWNFWGPTCTLVTYFVCYAVWIFRGIRKEHEDAAARQTEAYLRWRNQP
jgi:hypothetical protein